MLTDNKNSALTDNKNMALIDTLSVHTPSGGLHLYFGWPGIELRCSAGVLGEGLDVRAEGGYVVAPPSRLRVGDYSWQDETAPVAPVPSWLVDLTRKPDPVVSAPPTVTHGTSYARSALRRECELVESAIEGQRNGTLNVASFKLGTLVGAGLLDSGEADSSLLAAALACGLPEDEARSDHRRRPAGGSLATSTGGVVD